MKHFTSILAGSVIALSALTTATVPLSAQTPRQFSYQGILTDAISGKPYSGVHTITVRLYDAPMAAKPIWSEEHNATIEDGLFNLIVGSKSSLSLSFDRPYYIGISIDGKPEISRVPLVSVPYSLQAEQARSLAPFATGAVTSINGKEGDISIVGSNGIKVNNDGGIFRLEFDKNTLKDGEDILVPPTGAAGGDLSGTYPNPTIGNGKVATSKIADNAVTGVKIANTAITTTKIANDAVTGAKIANGTIITANIANKAITTPLVADNAITTVKIADKTITTANLADNAVQTQIIATNAVMTEKIRDLNVTTPKLADGAVSSIKLLDGAVTSPKLADNAVTSPKLANNAVTNPKLADNSVATNNIIDGTIQTVDIANNAVTTPKILDRNVTGKKIWTTGAVAGNVITFNGTDVIWGEGGGGNGVTTVPSPVCQNAFVRFGNTTGTQIQQGALILEDVTNGIVPISVNTCITDQWIYHSIALIPSGGGALQASKLGNPRGYNAIDWQIDVTEDDGGGTMVAGGDYSVIGGGYGNGISSESGDESNSGYGSTIAGGAYNTILGVAVEGSTIGGGMNNSIYSSISGEISGGFNSTIAGGENNSITGFWVPFSFIGGGSNNMIGDLEGVGMGSYSVIAGGEENNIYSNFSAIGGGSSNIISKQYAAIGGGVNNTVFHNLGFIGGGENNSIDSDNGVIGGGWDNSILDNGNGGDGGSGLASTIGGGRNNSISGIYAIIGGGLDNYIYKDYAFIGGGKNNSIGSFEDEETSDYAVIAGGNNNNITGIASAIGGGENNLIYGTRSNISGGNSNAIQGNENFVGGGNNNTVIGVTQAAILGGGNNAIGGLESGGNNSSILGGSNLTLTGNSSMGFLGMPTDEDQGNHPMTVSEDNTTVLGNVNLWLANNDSKPRELRFYSTHHNSGGNDAFPNTTTYTGFVAPATGLSDNIMYTLPQTAPTDGQILSANNVTAGVGITTADLEWINTPSASGVQSVTGGTGISVTGTASDPVISTSFDISNYVTTTSLTTTIGNYYTKTQTDSILNRAMPCGSIVMWSGSSVPAGWALCDGLDGRPDLNQRFPRGTAVLTDVGITGGNNSHSHSVDNHTHDFTFAGASGSGIGGTATFSGATESSATGITASGSLSGGGGILDESGTYSSSVTVDITDPEHTHSFSGSSTDVSITVDNISGSGTTDVSSGVGTSTEDNIPEFIYIGFIIRVCP